MKSKTFKYLAIIITCIFGINLLLAIPTFAADPVCDNPNISDELKAAQGCANSKKVPALQDTVTNIINGVIAVTGLVAVIFIIVGGVQYMTSLGEPGKIQKAKNTILYALIGLTICALSFAIVNWAIKGVIGQGGEKRMDQSIQPDPTLKSSKNQ